MFTGVYRVFTGKSECRAIGISNLWGLHVTRNPCNFEISTLWHFFIHEPLSSCAPKCFQEKIGKGKIYQIEIGKDRFVCKISISNTDGCLELESFLPFSSLGYVVYVFAHKSQPYLHSEPFTLCIKIAIIFYILKVS